MFRLGQRTAQRTGQDYMQISLQATQTHTVSKKLNHYNGVKYCFAIHFLIFKSVNDFLS